MKQRAKRAIREVDYEQVYYHHKIDGCIDCVLYDCVECSQCPVGEKETELTSEELDDYHRGTTV